MTSRITGRPRAQVTVIVKRVFGSGTSIVRAMSLGGDRMRSEIYRLYLRVPEAPLTAIVKRLKPDSAD